ncbi:hypothetical protein FJU30_10755 [Affinibrenneria salicis]|uniref:Uncharacterized protein n=1 Tax=Affinibrenneria salicis TaxID=2590031 RepID=A0A5J5G1X2_9GAMM|nr:hypothetical protein [Affinibrenneria salicis]KAA9000687.1 hypothetical protein FJU30_10755 [Affinibrenneria salicis]
MAQKYRDSIETMCRAQDIVIPDGFYRHAASRYAVIDYSAEQPRLVAKTWFNQRDLIYYLTRLADGRKLRVLDFKDRRELCLQGARLETGAAF